MIDDTANRRTVLEAENVTIFKSGEFFGNFTKVHARRIKIEEGRYAQHESATFVAFVPKGARKPRSFVVTPQSGKVITTSGYSTVEPDGMFDRPETDSTSGVTVQRGRYAGFDSRWASDFAARIDATDENIIFRQNV